MLKRKAAKVPLFVIAISLLCAGELRCETLPLDNEAVLCIYYKMSGRLLDYQDLEEFCFQSGSPLFTDFKPSEMFSKNSIRKYKIRLEEKMKGINYNTRFLWRLKGEIISRSGKQGRYRLVWDDSNMPAPTPFIYSELSKEGRESLREKLDSYVNEELEISQKGEFDITVSLVPRRIENRYQKRNIAHENVLLPLRYVIFHPIEIGPSDETMTSMEKF